MPPLEDTLTDVLVLGDSLCTPSTIAPLYHQTRYASIFMKPDNCEQNFMLNSMAKFVFDRVVAPGVSGFQIF